MKKLSMAEWVEQNVAEVKVPAPYQQAVIDMLAEPGELKMVCTDGDSGRSYVINTQKTAPARFFIDSLTLTGEIYLVPADRRMEWQAFDCQCEETSEELPLPAWARPIEQLSHVEFEMPSEIFK